jgi:multiple sugar transport system permease protein
MTTTAARASVPTRARKRPVGLYVSRVMRYLMLCLVGLILFAPFTLAFLGSFKSNAEVVAWPPTLLPKQWQPENWTELLATDMGGLPQESGMIALGGTMGLVAFFVALVVDRVTATLGTEKRASVALLVAAVVATLIAWGLVTAVKSESPLIGRLLVASGGLLALSLAGAGVVAVFKQHRLQKVAEFLLWPAMALLIAWVVQTESPYFPLALICAAVLLAAISRGQGASQFTSLSMALTGGAAVTLIFYSLAKVAGGATFVRWLLNTAILSLAVAILQVIFCSMSAYAFARLRFPGRDAIFSFMLASMMIPGAVTLVPSYVLMAKIKLVNTPWALVLPGIVGAFGIFMLTQFFKSIPVELEEAAVIDGASRFQIYYQVILPLARPALLTLFIMQFQGMWNAFLGPLLYLNTPDMFTLNVALTMFQQQYRYNWSVTLVGAMVNAAPILLLFFIFSKYYIEGIAYAGLKG